MKIQLEKKNKVPKKQRYLSKDGCEKKLSLINSGPISLAHELGSEVDSGLLNTQNLIENYLSPDGDERQDHIKEINNLKASSDCNVLLSEKQPPRNVKYTKARSQVRGGRNLISQETQIFPDLYDRNAMHSGQSCLSTAQKVKPKTSSVENLNEAGKSMAKFMKQKKKFTTIGEALLNDDDEDKGSKHKLVKLNL